MSHILDQSMEYTGAVAAETLLQMARMNYWILEDEIFGGDGLRWFIGDHKDHLVGVKDKIGRAHV